MARATDVPGKVSPESGEALPYGLGKLNIVARNTDICPRVTDAAGQ